VNANRGPDHKSSWLTRTLRVAARLLPSRFPLTRPASYAASSRWRATASGTSWRSIRTDYEKPSRLRREEAVYGRLLAALDERVIVPDRDVRAVLGDLAQIIDADNEYGRVVAEHNALYGLLGQVERSEGRS
jgi:hypothetical protein